MGSHMSVYPVEWTWLNTTFKLSSEYLANSKPYPFVKDFIQYNPARKSQMAIIQTFQAIYIIIFQSKSSAIKQETRKSAKYLLYFTDAETDKADLYLTSAKMH